MRPEKKHWTEKQCIGLMSVSGWLRV